MNYYPFYSGLPNIVSTTAQSTGLFGNLFKGLSLGKILSGGQKTLNFVNQALPLIKQAGPVINNAKTMFRVLNEFKNLDSIKPISQNSEDIISKNNIVNSDNSTSFSEANYEFKESNVYDSNNGLTFFQ